MATVSGEGSRMQDIIIVKPPVQQAPRELQEYAQIAGYQTKSQVGDQNRIDLDQSDMEAALFGRNFEHAKEVYTQGGFSRPFARVTLVAAGGMTAHVPKGSLVTGQAPSGIGINGTLMEELNLGETNVFILYSVATVFSKLTSCKVGSLPGIGSETAGCFTAQGWLTFDKAGSYYYEYDVIEDNKNNRTLQQFSANAEDQMLLCGEACPSATFEKYFKYYEVPDYGDRWIMAAFDMTKTTFHLGVADFKGVSDDCRAEVIRHSTVNLNVWMYVIRQLEDAVDRCKQEAGYSVDSWDQAVAFYTGFLEGTMGTEEGIMLYALAQKLCIEFKTCGVDGNNATGQAAVNYEISRRFEQGQTNLSASYCQAAEEHKNTIVNMMVVPLVQGTLLYTFIRESLQDGENSKGAVASFAASVLPLVHHCSPEDAEQIYYALKIGSEAPNFADVKKILERNYECMGITCSQVGGIYNYDKSDYFENSSPCTFSPSSRESKSGGSGLRIFLGILLLGIVPLILIGIAWRQKRRNKKHEQRQSRLRGLRSTMIDPDQRFASSRKIDPNDLMLT